MLNFSATGVVETLSVSSFMSLNIFAWCCLWLWTVLSLEKSSLLAPGFLSGVGSQEVPGSFWPLSPAEWALPGMVSSPKSLSSAAFMWRWGRLCHVASSVRGSFHLPCSPLHSLEDPAKPHLMSFFPNCFCLHWKLLQSYKIWVWILRALWPWRVSTWHHCG